MSWWLAARWYTTGVELPPLSCAYVSSDEEAMPLEAGPDGLEVLIVQFPCTEAFKPRI